jgi:hypothetical protein
MNTHSCENSKCHTTNQCEIITFSNCDELCEHCEPYLMTDLNTSQQPAINIKPAYFSEILVISSQPTQCHISEIDIFMATVMTSILSYVYWCFLHLTIL